MNQTETQYGPAMNALNARQRAFVEHYLASCTESAEGNATAAARAAGYADNGGAEIRVTAHRLLYDHRILAAIREMGEQTMQAFLPTALAAVRAEASNPQSKDRVKAALAAAAIAGLSPLTRTENRTVVEHTVNTDDLIAKAKMLAEKLGVDPRRLIGRKLEMIDVTPQVLDYDPNEFVAP